MAPSPAPTRQPHRPTGPARHLHRPLQPPPPHRALPHHATPATIYHTGIKATPTQPPGTDPHWRVRTDRIDKTGAVSLRVHGKLRHIGVGRTYARTHVKLLIKDLDVTIIDAATGQILRELTIDPSRDYQPIPKP